MKKKKNLQEKWKRSEKSENCREIMKKKGVSMFFGEI